MPYITLEYSNNIVEPDDFTDLFIKIHNILAAKLPTKIKNCKSHAQKFDNYHLADGNINNSFIHLNIKILEGRSKDIISDIGKDLLELLKQYFLISSSQLNLSISINIAEMKNYFKLN